MAKRTTVLTKIGALISSPGDLESVEYGRAINYIAHSGLFSCLWFYCFDDDDHDDDDVCLGACSEAPQVMGSTIDQCLAVMKA